MPGPCRALVAVREARPLVVSKECIEFIDLRFLQGTTVHTLGPTVCSHITTRLCPKEGASCVTFKNKPTTSCVVGVFETFVCCNIHPHSRAGFVESKTICLRSRICVITTYVFPASLLNANGKAKLTDRRILVWSCCLDSSYTFPATRCEGSECTFFPRYV